MINIVNEEKMPNHGDLNPTYGMEASEKGRLSEILDSDKPDN